MMTDGAKIAIGVVAALAGAAGVVALVKTTSAATPAPSSTATPTATPTPTTSTNSISPPSSSATWTPASTIQPGDHVRISVAPSDLATLAAALGLPTVDEQAWQQIMVTPQVQNVIHAPTLSAWGPGPDGTMQPGPLPADWPTSDAAAATEFHADFVYQGTTPLLVSSFPVPVTAWTGT
jgi:hypothetical protein